MLRINLVKLMTMLCKVIVKIAHLKLDDLSIGCFHRRLLVDLESLRKTVDALKLALQLDVATVEVSGLRECTARALFAALHT